MSSDVMLLLKLSEDRVVVGGDFVETDIASGVVSSGFMVVEGGQQEGWVRQPVMMDDMEGDQLYGGVDGAVVSGTCLQYDDEEGDECVDILLGGWFNSLQAISLQQGRINSTPASPSLQIPLARLRVSPSNTTLLLTSIPSPIPATNSTNRRGVNAMTMENQGTMLIGGFLPSVGHVARISSNLSNISPALQPPSQAGTDSEGGDTSSTACLDDYHVDSMLSPHEISFCCREGSLCPYVGMSAACPAREGFRCLPSDRHASCCQEGHYCPTAGVSLNCTMGYYCPTGSIKPIRCRWFEGCPHPNMARPVKYVGALYSLLLVVVLALLVILADRLFVFIRHVLREKRKRQRREARRSAPRLSPKRTGFSYYYTGDLSSLYKPLLGSVPEKEPSNGYSLADAPAALLLPCNGRRLPSSSASSVSSFMSGGGFLTTCNNSSIAKEISLHFERLTVEVPGPKVAFKEVTGGFRAGKVTAIMGPSGQYGLLAKSP